MRRLLTPRLRECLELARDGLTAVQIADALGLSYRTVNQYLSDCYRRLGARNRAQAVSIAIKLGEILPYGDDRPPFPGMTVSAPL
jgi:DNA-binding CsgD family transcriptional regulator